MNLRVIIAVLGFLLSAVSCTFISKQKSAAPFSAALKKSNKIIPKTKKNKVLYLKNDSICIVVDKKTYKMPRDTDIICDSSFAGIYEVGKDSIKKSRVLMHNNLIFFTTYYDVGMGNRGFLFVLDINKKRLVRDDNLKEKYLYSGVGVIFIDTVTNTIFTIEKPDWYEHPKIGFTTRASMYVIKGDRFKYLKQYYEVGELYEDSSLVKFYQKSLANNGKHGKTVPASWSNPANWAK
jgi:hypothetical protein